MIGTHRTKSRRPVSIVLAAATVYLLATTLPAQEDPTRKQIEANGTAVRKAIQAQDFSALEKLWSPRLLVNSPGNSILTRDQVLAALRDGELDYTKYENTVEAFRTYGDVAVLMGHEVLVPGFGPEAGKTFYRRYTDIWQRAGGSWVLISRQGTYTTATDMYADKKK